MVRPAPQFHPEWIIEAFHSVLNKYPGNSPHFLNISTSGVINFMSESLRNSIQISEDIKLESGDCCFKIFPSFVLPDFTTELNKVISLKNPGTFLYSFKEYTYKIFIIPVFSNSGNIDQVQLCFSLEGENGRGKTQFESEIEPNSILNNYSFKEYDIKGQNVLGSITDGFFLLNNSEEITYWNKAAADMLQIPGENILNQKYLKIFSILSEPGLKLKFQEAQRSKEKASFEYYFTRLDLWTDINIYPWKDGFSVYFKDISGRKKLYEEVRIAHERFKLVSKAIREAVYDWDIASNSIEWSDSYYELYGFEREGELLSISQWEQQIHPEDRPWVIEKLKTAINGPETQWNCEYRLLNAQRKIAIIMEQGYIIRNEKGVAIRMIGALQDITTLKQNERALEELNFQLKKHSAEVAQSNAELEQFAYIASHDLQEPLRMISSFLILLKKNYEKELDDKAKQYIHFATDGAQRMRQIILDLLDYSRIGKVKYDLQFVDVNDIIREVQLLHKAMILEKNVVIKYNQLPVIKAAAIPLLRVLSNLINNSIKYSKKDILPVIEILVKDREYHWEIIVQDNGIGINEQFKEKVFDIFQRLHSRDEYSGTGIGLAICKKIVENHGGNIWVNSTEGEGSSFHFTIPKHF